VSLRFSFLAWLFPNRFVERNDRWHAFSLYDWSGDGYEYQKDSAGLWNDTVKHPADTVATGVGDCEDYALVAASWAASNRREGVGLAVCGHRVGPVPVTDHMIAYDSRRVYSSGYIFDLSVDEYLKSSEYSWCWRRDLK